ncbi:MAG: transcriptional repressor [Armatimonadetes bacterium]|nr:transcriptional repressor [Armatimonadota bacterium]
MLTPELAAGGLRRSGARMTAQRRAVLEILSGNRTHPTAESIVSHVQSRLGYVSPATIYNTLQALEELGFVRRIEGLEHRAHFDPDTSDHQHAICRRCKRVWDVDYPQFLPGAPGGFVVEDVLIQGICAGCANIQDQSDSKGDVLKDEMAM